MSKPAVLRLSFDVMFPWVKKNPILLSNLLSDLDASLYPLSPGLPTTAIVKLFWIRNFSPVCFRYAGTGIRSKLLSPAEAGNEMRISEIIRIVLNITGKINYC